MSELNNAIIKNNWTFKDLSDATTKRLRIKFPNGLGISIVQGFGTYGNEQGLYEIAPLNLEEDLDGSLLNIEGDDVMGRLSEIEVLEKCNEIASIVLSPDLICDSEKEAKEFIAVPMLNSIFLEDLKGMSEEAIKEHLISEYEASPESLKDLKILIAYESVGSWGCDSSSYFLFKKDKKYFEVFGSHCSCFGFEGQFDLEETTIDALKIMAKKGFNHTGGYDDNAKENKKAIRGFIKNL